MQVSSDSEVITMMRLCIVVLIALAGTALAAADAEPVTAKSVQANGVKAYVYNPQLLGTNGTVVCFIVVCLPFTLMRAGSDHDMV